MVSHILLNIYRKSNPLFEKHKPLLTKAGYHLIEVRLEADHQNSMVEIQDALLNAIQKYPKLMYGNRLCVFNSNLEMPDTQNLIIALKRIFHRYPPIVSLNRESEKIHRTGGEGYDKMIDRMYSMKFRAAYQKFVNEKELQRPSKKVVGDKIFS